MHLLHDNNDQLLSAGCQVHVVYLAQLLGAVLFIHFISNHDNFIIKDLCGMISIIDNYEIRPSKNEIKKRPKSFPLSLLPCCHEGKLTKKIICGHVATQPRR